MNEEGNPALREGEPSADGSKTPWITLLDVGPEKYGDAIACRFGAVSVLVDGAHRSNARPSPGHESLLQQLQSFLGVTGTPVEVTLLIVTHAHDDHIGCLPELVQRGELRAKWALVVDPDNGWPSAQDFPSRDSLLGQVALALREEPLAANAAPQDIRALIADAQNLESRYRTMLETLAAQGTRVVRHDGTEAQVRALCQTLSTQGVTLDVLGPSAAQLQRAAALLAGRLQDVLTRDADTHEVGADAIALYRRMVLRGQPDSPGADEQDAARAGHFVNLQSLVTAFTYGGKRLLLTGDMQLADPQTGDEELTREWKSLRARVMKAGPFDFVKLAHHGSWNGLDEELLRGMGTPQLLGICAGEESKSHPSVEVLRLLRKYRNEVEWVRTDRHGRSTIRWDGEVPDVVLSIDGSLNDLRPPPGASRDETPRPAVFSPPLASGEAVSAFRGPRPPPPEEEEAASAPEETARRPQAGGESPVVVTARIPPSTLPVTITITVEQRQDHPPGPAESEERLRGDVASSRPPRSSRQPRLHLFGGRPSPPALLIATNPRALRRNIGKVEAEALLNALSVTRNVRLFELPERASIEAAEAAALVQAELRSQPQVEGVLLLGGYDVIPAHRMDCLPPTLRAQLKRSDILSDGDHFIVWSDDPYGDKDGDGWPDLPVSRIPDGRAPGLLLSALQAGGATQKGQPSGIRNSQRPFADNIFKMLPGAGPLLQSAPTTYKSRQPPVHLGGDCVYIMLHGDHSDGTRFWGEGVAEEAVRLSNIPRPAGAVVFTGCCWGALTVDAPAYRQLPGSQPAPRTPAASIALTFLLHGALAYVGCTGSHYSPLDPPFDYFGAPLHSAFWQAHLQGAAPAVALLRAKEQYAKGLPHRRADVQAEAIEYKILRQYTCLGLGW